MTSNLTNQSRNVLSKKFMVNKKEAVDNVNLFSVITLICFLLLVPAALLIDGVKFTPTYLQSIAKQVVNVRELCVRSLLSGPCFHTDQQRCIGISTMGNTAGTALAFAGIFSYSRAKQLKENLKAA